MGLQQDGVAGVITPAVSAGSLLTHTWLHAGVPPMHVSVLPPNPCATTAATAHHVTTHPGPGDPPHHGPSQAFTKPLHDQRWLHRLTCRYLAACRLNTQHISFPSTCHTHPYSLCLLVAAHVTAAACRQGGEPCQRLTGARQRLTPSWARACACLMSQCTARCLRWR